MQIDWGKTIDDIFANKMSCLRCSAFDSSMVAGYSPSPAAAQYAPRCQECDRRDDCEARKLVVVCEACARELRIRAKPVDHATMMAMLMDDCRKDLEDCLDYLADYWQEELEIDPDEAGRLEELAPEAFAEEDAWRRRLEEEYLSYHGWFRENGVRVPNPGWRTDYVEEIIALGYASLLGD